jgi:hypothetical protein
MKKVFLAACIAASVMFVACNEEKPATEETQMNDSTNVEEAPMEETPATDSSAMNTDSAATEMPADSAKVEGHEGH